MASTARPTTPALDLGKDSVLLSELMQDGRASYEDLSTRVGTSRQTVWRRVQAMMGSLIWGFSPVMDHRRLGWRHYLIVVPASPSHDTLGRVEQAETAMQGVPTIRLL